MEEKQEESEKSQQSEENVDLDSHFLNRLNSAIEEVETRKKGKGVMSPKQNVVITRTYYERALQYFKKEDYKMVRDDVEKALKYSGNLKDIQNLRQNCDLKLLLAVVCCRQEDFEGALTMMKKIASTVKKYDLKKQYIDPNVPLLHGKILLDLGRFDEARRFAESAKDLGETSKCEYIINDARECLARCKVLEKTSKFKQNQAELAKMNNKEETNAENVEEKASFEIKASDVTSQPLLDDLTIEERKIAEKASMEAHASDVIPCLKDVTGEDEKLEGLSDFGVRKATLMENVFENGRFVKQIRSCSTLECSNEFTAQYQQHVSKVLENGAVKVISVVGNMVSLEEITSDLKSWYSSMFSSSANHNWWNYIQSDLKKLLRGILRSLANLYPALTHGNWVNGLAVFRGEAKAYNMKYLGNTGYIMDINCLHLLILRILMKIPPTELCNFDCTWTIHCADFSEFCDTLSSHAFRDFMTDMHLFVEMKRSMLCFYPPFFWESKERSTFLEGLHDIFWTERDFLTSPTFFYLNSCFLWGWMWWKLVPPSGVFYNILNFKNNEAVSQVEPTYKGIDSIKFWRNCRHHYNSNRDQEEPLTVEEIEIEVNEKFNICWQAFRAVKHYLNKPTSDTDNEYVSQKLLALLESCNCSFIYLAKSSSTDNDSLLHGSSSCPQNLHYSSRDSPIKHTGKEDGITNEAIDF